MFGIVTARSASVGRRSRPILASAAAVVGLFGLDALLFRTPLYPSIIEPDSSTGVFEAVFRRERQAQLANGDNMVATVGDSRFAYAPKLCNEIKDKTGYVFRNAGVAGSDARAWYYMLRDLDPTARRYRAIVIGVMDYDDEDEAFRPDEDVRILHYAIARLRWSDIPELAGSFDKWKLRWEVIRGAALKGIVLQRDIMEFLSHPVKRIDYVKLCRRGYEEWTYNYLETAASMAGLSVDWATLKADFPPGMTDDQRDTVNSTLLRKPVPQTGALAAFRRSWYGKIIDYYRGSRTKVIFVRLPRGPIPRPDWLVQKKSSSIREFASRPNVLLCDEHAFDSLEQPPLFRDALHLNRDGIARFSPMLAERIGRMIDAADAVRGTR